MDLLNLKKSREQREQMQRAQEIVAIANKIMDELKTQNLKTYEVRLVIKLMGERLNNNAAQYVENQDYNLIDVKPEEKKV